MSYFIDVFGLKKREKLLRDELYVMLMLQRSEEGTSKVDCDDAAIAVACALDSDKCPAECKEGASDEKDEDTKVKSGDLAVKATANNGGVILAAGISDMDTLTFKTSEEVEITKVVLERYGYSKNENVKRVWLEDENGTIITNEADSLNSKAQATLTLKKDYRKVDGALNATIVIEADAEAGNTIGFKVVDVNSTAKNTDKGDYSPYTYSVVNYDGADLILTTRSADKTYNWEAGESYEVAKFKLKAPSDSAIEVKSFTLTDADKNAIEYDDFLEDVTVTVAGKEVKSSWSVNKDDELVINLKDVELAAKENADFIVSIKLADGFDNMGESTNFYIAKTADISATDAKTSSRVLVKALDTYDADDAAKGIKKGDHKPYAGDPTEWYTCTFDGGKVQITSEKLGNVEASEDSTDIVIAKGEISTSQTIKVSKDTIKVTVKNSGTKKVVKAMRLSIAGDDYEGSFDEATNTFSFPAIDVDKTSKIELLVDTVESGNENDYATFKISGLRGDNEKTLNGFYYEESKTLADISGSLNISRLTLTASKAGLTNSKSSDEVEFKAGSVERKAIFEGEYTAKKKDIYLNKFTFEGDTWDYANEMTVYLSIDGKVVADADLKNGKASDSFTNLLVEAGKSVKVVVEAEVDAAEYDEDKANTNPQQHLVDAVKFTLTLEGEDSNGNDNSGIASKQTAKVSVVKVGTPEVETGKAKSTVLLRGTTDPIAELTVKPSGSSSIDLESVSFLADGVNGKCDNFKLEGDVEEDFVLSTDKTRCVADGFVEPVSEKGITIKIVFDDDPSESDMDNAEHGFAVANIKGIILNNTEISEEFNKGYAEGIISFSQSGKGDTETTYVVEDIKGYKTSAKISNVVFYAKDKTEFESSISTSTKSLSKGDKFTITNLCNGAENIEYMTYKVTEGNKVWNVKVDYTNYEDYFTTVGGERLKVFDNGKDTCAATDNKGTGKYTDITGGEDSAVATSIVTLAAADDTTQINLGGLTTKTISDLQSGITIDGSNIKGTIKKVSDTTNWVYTDVNMPTTYDHFIALTVDEDDANAGLQCNNTSVYDTVSSSYKAVDPVDCVIIWAVDTDSVLKVKKGTDIANYYFNFATFNS